MKEAIEKINKFKSLLRRLRKNNKSLDRFIMKKREDSNQ